MKIQIFKKNGDESIYYILDSGNEETLNFDNIKNLAIKMLEMHNKPSKTELEVIITDPSLELYKTTVENVLNNIEEDAELIELFEKQKRKDDDEQSTDQSEEVDLQVEKSI